MDAGSTRLDAATPHGEFASLVPLRRMLGEAGLSSAQQRTHDCARPVRLSGSTQLVNPTTGEVRTVYSSEQELDGTTWIPCGQPPGRSVCAVQRHLQAGRLGPDHHGSRRRQGHPCDGRRPSLHLRHPDCTLVRRRARHPAERPVPGPPGQAGLRARTTAVVQQAPPGRGPPAGGAAVRRLLRLHRPCGLAVVRPRAVAPVHHCPAAPARPPGRPVGSGGSARSLTPRSWSSRPAG